MREDLERWERKYRELSTDTDLEPDPLLLKHQHLLNGAGRACDIACGVGQNGLYLAEHGYDSFLIDGSFVALTMAGRVATARGLRIFRVVADLDYFRLPVSAFDVIVVMRYLNRSISSDICAALRPGGVLFFETFNVNFLSEKPGFPRDYLLAPGEARSLFATLECLASNDGPTLQDSLSYLVGRRRGT